MEPQILNLDFPPFIETERLKIRSPQPGDGPIFNAAIVETLTSLQEWLGIYQDGPPSIEESEAFLRERYADFILRKKMMLLCFLKASGDFVLCSALDPNWKVPSFEIGYWCRFSYQGQGYVTEAVRGITDFAFMVLNARRVSIRCDTDNYASANVARRAGFEHEGIMRNDSRKQSGELRSTHFFSIVRPD